MDLLKKNFESPCLCSENFLHKMRKLYYAAILFVFIFSAACWKSIEEDGNTRTRNNTRNSSSPTPGATAAKSNTQSTSPTPDMTNNTTVTNNGVPTNDTKSGGFTANLPGGFVQPTDDVGRKMLKEYGAVFVARGGATPPKTVIFKDEAEVSAFQNGLQKAKESIGGFSMELQSAAMQGLKNAIAEAKQSGLNITPRGADSARRTYNETVKLWASRVDPGLKHWVGKGKLSQADASRIKSLSPFQQVPEIFKLEAQGMFFAKDLSKSIIYSVAPPGTSQHLSMLALDVKENDNAKVRDILAKHGWFQTVVSDLPHFTFLGVAESELSNLGLKKVSDGGRSFWLPNI
jgi:hypothetical protein